MKDELIRESSVKTQKNKKKMKDELTRREFGRRSEHEIKSD